MMGKKVDEKVTFRGNFVKCIKSYLKHLITNFVKNTNLHGCQYVLNREKHGIVSMAWTTIIITSLFFAIYLIKIQLERFQETTILNSIATTGYPVWKTPFPAVIICNNNIVYKPQADRIKSMLTSKGFLEKEVNKFFEHLSALVVCQNCDDNITLYTNTSDLKIYSFLEDLNYDMNELMMELAHPCGKMIKKCYWKSDVKNCDRLFRTVRTTLGYCCAFNYFATIDVQHDNFEKQLQYSGGFGSGSGLQVVINIEPSEYISPIKTTAGVEILVGDVYQFAEMGLYSHSLSGGQVLNMGLYPTIYGSHTDLLYTNDKSRGCWFYNEGSSRWSKTYNTLTCFNECKASFIFETCGCVPFYYSFTGIRRVCTIEDVTCIVSNENKFAQILMSNDLEEDAEFLESHGITYSKLCYCLPGCEETVYEIYKNIKEVTHLNNSCTINIHFTAITGTLMIRTVHVTWDTLLATIGGIFGLCMGGSILSIVELIFLIFNTCFKVRNETKARKSFNNRVKQIKIISKPYPHMNIKEYVN